MVGLPDEEFDSHMQHILMTQSYSQLRSRDDKLRFVFRETDAADTGRMPVGVLLQVRPSSCCDHLTPSHV